MKRHAPYVLHTMKPWPQNVLDIDMQNHPRFGILGFAVEKVSFLVPIPSLKVKLCGQYMGGLEQYYKFMIIIKDIKCIEI